MSPEPSTARCHLSISFDTPWYGFSGEGDRISGTDESSSGEGTLRFRAGLVLGAGARIAGDGLLSKRGELCRGNPLMTPLVSGGFELKLEYAIPGESREGKPEGVGAGEVRPFEGCFSMEFGPVFSGTARLDFATPEEPGES